MQTTLKKWGNGSGVLFTKEVLRLAGVSINDTFDIMVADGKIILTPVFRHRSLKERAAEFNGELNLCGELDRGEPVGREVW